MIDLLILGNGVNIQLVKVTYIIVERNKGHPQISTSSCFFFNFTEIKRAVVPTTASVFARTRTMSIIPSARSV